MFFIYSTVWLRCLLKSKPESTLLSRKSPREWPVGIAGMLLSCPCSLEVMLLFPPDNMFSLNRCLTKQYLLSVIMFLNKRGQESITDLQAECQGLVKSLT